MIDSTFERKCIQCGRPFAALSARRVTCSDRCQCLYLGYDYRNEKDVTGDLVTPFPVVKQRIPRNDPTSQLDISNQASTTERPLLGTTTNYATPPVDKSRLLAAFKLLNPVHKLYKKDHQSDQPVIKHGSSGWPHRSSYCYERVLPGHLGAELRRSIDDPEKVGIGQVLRCSNVHMCPVCGLMSNLRWQDDLKTVERDLRDDGYRLLLFVLTISHTDRDTLEQEMDVLRKAYSKLFSQQKKTQKKRASRWGIVGRYRAWDIVYGKNGWHAHINVVVAVDPNHPYYKIEDIFADFDRVYRMHVHSSGGFASMNHGLSVSEYKNGKAYVLKSGMDNITAVKVGDDWGITQEAISGSKKQSGVDIGTLRAALVSPYISRSDGLVISKRKAAQLCLEYAATMTGERTVVSAGVFRDRLRDLRGGDLTDHEATEMIPVEEEYVIDGIIESRDWIEKIVVPDRIAQLVAAMRSGKPDLIKYLASINVKLSPGLTAKELATQSAYKWKRKQDRDRAIGGLDNKCEQWSIVNEADNLTSSDLDDYL